MTKRRLAMPPSDLPLSALTPFDALCFLSGWHPPITEHDRLRSRWQTWDQYLDTWRRVRAAFDASALPREDRFVDRVVEFVDRHGREALDDASYENLKYGDV